MDYKTTYHAISQPDIISFNKELKQYTDEGYIPYGTMTVAIAHTDSQEDYVISIYAILLGKTTKIEA